MTKTSFTFKYFNRIYQNSLAYYIKNAFRIRFCAGNINIIKSINCHLFVFISFIKALLIWNWNRCAKSKQAPKAIGNRQFNNTHIATAACYLRSTRRLPCGLWIFLECAAVNKPPDNKTSKILHCNRPYRWYFSQTKAAHIKSGAFHWTNKNTNQHHLNVYLELFAFDWLWYAIRLNCCEIT